jgi:hypothetical protein
MSTPNVLPVSCLEGRRGTDREVVPWRDAGEFRRPLDRAIVAACQRDRVARIDRDEQRLEEVIAVCAPTRHVQEQVELRGRGDGDAMHEMA